MAKRGKASRAGEASVPPALSASERETVDASVASLSGLNLDQLRLQWRNQLGGIAPAHLPGWLLMRVPRGPGNGILRAETGGRFWAQNSENGSEFGSQTAN